MEKECVEKECSLRIKHRENQEYQDLIHRLNRMEGQIRGIKAMVEEERYCVDILTQVSAVNAALNAFSKSFLENHMKTCVVEDIKNGREETVEEFCSILQKLMK